jgi:hypothetical protein
MRAWLLWIAFAATPALAGAPGRLDLAPAGECAGEERELAVALLPKPPAEEDAKPPASVLHLNPNEVAASAVLVSPSLPEPAAFSGPGACDNPGSGCALGELVEDPDPGTGCGFPGSACP